MIWWKKNRKETTLCDVGWQSHIVLHLTITLYGFDNKHLIFSLSFVVSLILIKYYFQLSAPHPRLCITLKYCIALRKPEWKRRPFLFFMPAIRVLLREYPIQAFTRSCGVRSIPVLNLHSSGKKLTRGAKGALLVRCHFPLHPFLFYKTL